jgi:hypothetical protein
MSTNHFDFEAGTPAEPAALVTSVAAGAGGGKASDGVEATAGTECAVVADSSGLGVGSLAVGHA